MAIALTLASGRAARADQDFFTWQGDGGANFWSVAFNWNPDGVPNGAGDVAVFNGGTTCNLNLIGVVLDKLGNGPGDVLNILNDADLFILGDPDPSDADETTGIFSIRGTVNMLGTSNATSIAANGHTLTIGNIFQEPCSINMSDSPNNFIYGVNGGHTVQFDQSLYVNGAGQIGLNTVNVNNWGRVVANKTNILYLDPASLWQNFGEISAQDGGTLRLEPGRYDNTPNNVVGLIAARNGSVVQLNNAHIDGLVQTFGTGVVRCVSTGAGTILEDVTLAGTIEMPNDADAVLRGQLAGGSVNMLASSNATQLFIDGPVVLWSGVINMSNSPNNLINNLSGGLSGDHLTNWAGQIRGSGQLGANSIDIDNHASIVADQSNFLFVDPLTTCHIFGSGSLGAQGGGTLQLDPGLFDNDGNIAANSGTVRLNNCTIEGGLLGGSGSGKFMGVSIGAGTTLSGVTLRTVPLEFPNDVDMRFTGFITNESAINMLASSNATQMFIDGPVSLAGGGVVNLSNSPNNFINNLGGGLPGDFFTNENNLIRGAGQIGLNSIDITNRGTIRADYSGGLLILDPVLTLINEGLIETSGGGVIRCDAGTYNNTGAFLAGAASRIDLNACTINGLLSTAGDGYFQVITIGASTTVDSVINAGRLSLPNDADLRAVGSITNSGRIDMNASSNATQLYIDGPVTLTGGGVVNLSNSPNNFVNNLGGGLADDFLVNQDNLIRGAGQIGLNSIDITNRGTIQADHPGSYLFLDPVSTLLNEGVVVAASGGLLRLDPGVHDHQAGLLLVRDASRCDLNGCTIRGDLATEGSGFFQIITIGASTWLDAPTIMGAVTQPNDADVRLTGTIVHDGTWNVNASSNATQVFVDGPLVLTGGGQMVLSNSINNFFNNLGGGLPDDSLTLEDYTIRGAGQIGLNTIDVTNRGTILADRPSTLYLDPITMLANEGTIRTAAASAMRWDPGVYTNAGDVIVDAGSRIDLASGSSYTQSAGRTMVFGELESVPNLITLNGGRLGGTGLVDSNVQNNAGIAAPGASAGTLAIEGNYTQAAGGFMEVELESGSSADRMTVTGVASLNGTLNVVALGGYRPPNGATFTIINAGSVAGNFTSVVESFPGSMRSVVDGSTVFISYCMADFGAPAGVLNVFDFLAFQTAFGSGSLEADLAAPFGVLNIFDFLAFQTAFGEGC